MTDKLEQRLELIEEAVLEQAVVLSWLFDKLGYDLEDILIQLFTRPKNIDIISSGFKNRLDVPTLQRVVKRWTELASPEESRIIQLRKS